MAESIGTGIPEGITTVNCNLVEEAERKTEKMYKDMGYRSYTGEQVENHDKIYKKLKNAWELPKKLTEEEKHQNEEFERYFS